MKPSTSFSIPNWDVSDYVLGKIPPEEHDKFESATSRAAQAAIDWATAGTAFAMNKYNADPEARKKSGSARPKPNRNSDSDSITPDNPRNE